MDTIAELEQNFESFMNHLPTLMPDGIYEVNLELLAYYSILKDDDQNAQIPHFFHVVESKDKITLFNDEFVTWIVPELIDQEPTTLVLIALRKENHQIALETGFVVTGVYNTSRIVLRVLEKFLSEIHENEECLALLFDEKEDE